VTKITFKFPPHIKAIIWDFDGVIKDSLSAKTEAFVHIFRANCNVDVIEKIKKHHTINGGVSRSVKIPLYLQWLNINPSKSNIEKYLGEFSKVVVKKVVDSPWVEGVEYLLKNKPEGMMFFLVTATPTTEIHEIIKELSLNNIFTEIHGYPKSKLDSTKDIMKNYSLQAKDVFFIGDSLIDMQTSKALDITFILRLHKDNQHLKPLHPGKKIMDFVSYE